MKKLPINKNIILVLVLVLLAVAGYFIFFRGEEPEDLTTVTSNVSTVSGQLVVELNRLNALRTIDDGLFKNESFISLVDITQPVVAQPLGRSNPFLPIGAN